jgi:hypothetical protein
MQNLIDKAQRNRSLRKSLINLKHGTKLWIMLNCVKIWSSDVHVRNMVLRVISSFIFCRKILDQLSNFSTNKDEQVSCSQLHNDDLQTFLTYFYSTTANNTTGATLRFNKCNITRDLPRSQFCGMGGCAKLFFRYLLDGNH